MVRHRPVGAETVRRGRGGCPLGCDWDTAISKGVRCTEWGPVADSNRLIAGRYRLQRCLGGGGFGRVWHAYDEKLRTEVALKEITFAAALEPDEYRELIIRAEREARNAAQLRDHPNIVTIHDVLIDNGTPWIVMQLVTGHTLGDQVRHHGPLPVDHVAHIANALLQAINTAHRAGIVHRDIKPANVMLGEGGRVLLTDFGIATASTDTTLTAASGFVGSMEYIAPERITGVDGDPASDLFSLGATLYFACEARSAFRRDTPAAALSAILFADPPALERADWLAPLITRLLNKDPEARPTVSSALEFLATARPHHAIPVPPAPVGAEQLPTPPADVRRLQYRRRKLLRRNIIGGTAILALAALVVALLVVIDRATNSGPSAAVGDCVSVADGKFASLGSCSDSESPYLVYQRLSAKRPASDCAQQSIRFNHSVLQNSYRLCLQPHVLKGGCYKTVQGPWIINAECGPPGTYRVVETIRDPGNSSACLYKTNADESVWFGRDLVCLDVY